jgi:acetyl-CoA carboxylase beta subunit/acetyl-CoA carboxylase alpha subunit
MPRILTDALLTRLLDPGSWEPWPVAAESSFFPEDGAYQQKLSEARMQSGESESIVIGQGRMAGAPVAIVASVFDFLAGSVGRLAADRVVYAFDRAAALRLPVLGLPTSGGVRMQEGTPAFLRMAAIAGAVQRHSQAGLPYLVWLRHPTTGGVFATWGSLGDITYGQPKALVGFLGPRVYEGLYNKPLPEGVQTSEGLTESGVIDGALAVEHLRETVARCLEIWRGHPEEVSIQPHAGEPCFSQDDTSPEPPTAWDAVLATRSETRGSVQSLLDHADAVVPLSGTGEGEVASATVLALASLAGTSCVVVGHDAQAQNHGARIGPGDLRVARRGMALATKWGLPFVSVIDTQGGELSAEAERGAMAGEIARCLAELSTLPVPTMALLLGGGAGGAALALLPADTVLAVRDAYISPLPPEGAALILYRDRAYAPQMAAQQRITCQDLLDVGAVDVVLPALAQSPSALTTAYQELATELRGLVSDAAASPGMEAESTEARLAARAARWRALGW